MAFILNVVGINILCGAGVLTLPYAVKEGGWLGLFVLFCFGIITCYTGILLKRCLESSHGLYSYLDIGQAAFGISGRVFVSVSFSNSSEKFCLRSIVRYEIPNFLRAKLVIVLWKLKLLVFS